MSHSFNKMKEPHGAAPFFRRFSGSYDRIRRAALGILLIAMAGCASPDAADNFNKAALMALEPKAELAPNLVEACNEDFKRIEAFSILKLAPTVLATEYSPALTVRFSRPLVEIGRQDFARNMAVYVIDRPLQKKPRFGGGVTRYACVLVDDKNGTFDPAAEDFLTTFPVSRTKNGYRFTESSLNGVLKKTCRKAGGTYGVFGCYMRDAVGGA